MKKLTKANIEQLAQEIMKFLEQKGLNSGVCIYYNNKRMRSDGHWDGEDLTYSWVEELDMDPHDYFEYAAYEHILSMSFEGGLYDVLNYSFGKREEQFRELFEKYGLYFELGNSWNLSVYLIDDNIEVEYTYYNEPQPITDLYYFARSNYPHELTTIMDVWYKLSSYEGDKGSCVIGAGFSFEWRDTKYFMNACSPWQGSISWESHTDIIRALLTGIGATNISYNWGNMD
jgi:hypothetical protein